MLAYNFNEENGSFIGSEEMLPDPLEPGRYLQPANSTLVPPPEFNPENQHAAGTVCHGVLKPLLTRKNLPNRNRQKMSCGS